MIIRKNAVSLKIIGFLFLGSKHVTCRHATPDDTPATSVLHLAVDALDHVAQQHVGAPAGLLERLLSARQCFLRDNLLGVPMCKFPVPKRVFFDKRDPVRRAGSALPPRIL